MKMVLTSQAVLRQLRIIRCLVSRPIVQSLVTSLVLWGLNYGNATSVVDLVIFEGSCSTYMLVDEI